ncbi:MAG: hypothetical protein JWR10_440 [Rubritepida sp.]|nr:hypothetical protein [Rubritepida sp.]
MPCVEAAKLDASPLEYRPGKWLVSCTNGRRNRHVDLDATCWYEARFLAPLEAGGEFQQWDVVGAKMMPPVKAEPAGWKASIIGGEEE